MKQTKRYTLHLTYCYKKRLLSTLQKVWTDCKCRTKTSCSQYLVASRLSRRCGIVPKTNSTILVVQLEMSIKSMAFGRHWRLPAVVEDYTTFH